MDAPVISPVGGYGQLGGTRTRLYNNPHFDYLSGMLPQDIKQLFQWCEFISVTMPHLGSVDTDMHRSAVQKAGSPERPRKVCPTRPRGWCARAFGS